MRYKEITTLNYIVYYNLVVVEDPGCSKSSWVVEDALLPTTDGCKTYKVDLKICVETDMRNETSHVAEILIHLLCV